MEQEEQEEFFIQHNRLQLLDLKEMILFFQQLHQQVVDKHVET